VTSLTRGKRIVAYCYSRAASQDATNEILVRLDQATPIEVADHVLHELCHAADDCQHGHKKIAHPTDTRLLLRALAQNPEGAGAAPDQGGTAEATPTAGEAASTGNDEITPQPGQTVAVSEQPWKAAKIRLGKAAQSGARDDLRSAGEAYVRARGGPPRA